MICTFDEHTRIEALSTCTLINDENDEKIHHYHHKNHFPAMYFLEALVSMCP